MSGDELAPVSDGERLPYPADLYPGCPCLACDSKTWPEWASGFGFVRMALCPTCGNKRCPAASDHVKWECNGSNDTGQTARPKVTPDPTQAPQADETLAGSRVLTERGLEILIASRRVHFDPGSNGGDDYIAVGDLLGALTHVRTIRDHIEGCPGDSCGC